MQPCSSSLGCLNNGRILRMMDVISCLRGLFKWCHIPHGRSGMKELQDNVKMFCGEQGLDAPDFWTINLDKHHMGYAVSLHLSGNDLWEEFDAKAVFVLKDFSERENREAERLLVESMLERLGEPVLLTVKDDISKNQERFFRELGMTMVPVRWTDSSASEYAVYTKGKFDMGGFVNLMEHVEHIGREVVYKQWN